jgi:hypothetical protein
LGTAAAGGLDARIDLTQKAGSLPAQRRTAPASGRFAVAFDRRGADRVDRLDHDSRTAHDGHQRVTDVRARVRQIRLNGQAPRAA